MLQFIEYFTAVAMTIISVWRFPAVRYGDAHRRALWGGYAGFAVALWLSTSVAITSMTRLPVVDLNALLRHFFSGMAIMAALTYVSTSYGKSSAPVVPRHVAVSRWIARVAYRAGAVGMALLIILFFTVVDRDTPSTDFVLDHAGEWGAALYMSVFYFFPLVTTAVCGYQWTRAMREAEMALMRIGLLLMAIAMWMGLVYTASRIALMWVAVVHPLAPSVVDQVVQASAIWMNVLFLLVAVGVSIPTTRAAASRWRRWRTLYRLYPLWFDLMTAFPGTSLYPPGSRFRELLHRHAPSDVRVDRWTQDIADAYEKMRYYAPDDLRYVAEEVTVAHGDPEPAAEAYWIAAALRAVATQQPSSRPVRPLQAKPFVDTDSEAAWLTRVCKIYLGVPASRAEEVLEHAQGESVAQSSSGGTFPASAAPLCIQPLQGACDRYN
ncbi:MAB_1171c family putative transporter [Streptomyces sp. NPDC056361]|uniref:MAB_1171c family putative transporter n=1 Tax=Streptomyces sp. NPDC056361 TaxID=3345795 RepID=UPI0035E1BBF8